MLKKLYIIGLVLVLGFEVQAQEVNWITFEEAVELNKKEPKMLLVDLYTNWCGWCKKMDRDTYTNPEVVRLINKYFYPVKFNAEQKEDVTFDGHTFKYVAQGNRGVHQLAAALTQNKLSYPTTVFMDEQVRIIQPIPGYMTAANMLPILEYIGGSHFKDTPWEEFQKNYKNPQ